MNGYEGYTAKKICTEITVTYPVFLYFNRFEELPVPAFSIIAHVRELCRIMQTEFHLIAKQTLRCVHRAF